MDSFRLYALIGIGSALAVSATVLLRRRPKNAADLERERRTWLDSIGRITDGTVIDVQELRSRTTTPLSSLFTSMTLQACRTNAPKM